MKKFLRGFLALAMVLQFAVVQTAQAGGSVLYYIPQNALYFFRISTYENNPFGYKIQDFLNQLFYHTDTVKMFDERTLSDIFVVAQSPAVDNSQHLVTYYIFTMPETDFNDYLAKVPANLLQKYKNGDSTYYGLNGLYFSYGPGNIIQSADNQAGLLALLNQKSDITTTPDYMAMTNFESFEAGFFEGYFNFDGIRTFDSQNSFALNEVSSAGFTMSEEPANSQIDGMFEMNIPSQKLGTTGLILNPSFEKLTNFSPANLVLYPHNDLSEQHFDSIFQTVLAKEFLSNFGQVSSVFNTTFQPNISLSTPFGCANLPSYDINSLFKQPLNYNFKDVSSSASYYPYVQDMLQKGIMEGYQTSDGRLFKPNDPITRAEFLKLIWASNVKTSGNYSDLSPQKFFHDVDPCSWAAPYINKAFVYTFIDGYSDGTFKPNNPITKAEALQVFYNADYNLRSPDLQSGALPYQDVHSQDWFYTPLNAAFHFGIIDSAKNFHPGDFLTRAEAAKIFSLWLHKQIDAQ